MRPTGKLAHIVWPGRRHGSRRPTRGRWQLLGIPGLLAPAGLVAAPTALLLGGLSLLHAAPAAAQAQLPERFRLTSLTLSVGGSPVTLTPSFTPATNLFYRATVDYDATSISVTASWSGSKAVLASSKDWRDLTAPFLSEEAFASSGSSVSLNLKAGGVTGINLSVDTTTTYNITIHRRPSTDATLSGLTAEQQYERLRGVHGADAGPIVRRGHDGLHGDGGERSGRT